MYEAINNIPVATLNRYGRYITEYTYNTLTSVDMQYYQKQKELKTRAIKI